VGFLSRLVIVVHFFLGKKNEPKKSSRSNSYTPCRSRRPLMSDWLSFILTRLKSIVQSKKNKDQLRKWSTFTFSKN